MIGQFQYGPLALDHLSKRQMISFFSRNNQQSHIINILLASFARSVQQVMDHVFFLPCFNGTRASRLGHKRKGKNSVHNLSYGPRTRLIRGMYFPFLSFNLLYRTACTFQFPLVYCIVLAVMYCNFLSFSLF